MNILVSITNKDGIVDFFKNAGEKELDIRTASRMESQRL